MVGVWSTVQMAVLINILLFQVCRSASCLLPLSNPPVCRWSPGTGIWIAHHGSALLTRIRQGCLTPLITLRARGIEGMTSLLDISDPYKSSQLCTILVNNGMAKEALEFAPKCSVNIAEVWVAWGFKCLRE